MAAKPRGSKNRHSRSLPVALITSRSVQAPALRRVLCSLYPQSKVSFSNLYVCTDNLAGYNIFQYVMVMQFGFATFPYFTELAIFDNCRYYSKSTIIIGGKQIVIFLVFDS